MKRSPIKKKKHKPTPVHDWYKDTYHQCELALYCGVTFNQMGEPCFGSRAYEPGHEVHHIWSIGRRPDLRSNMIRVSWAAHQWFHRNDNLARVICVLAKLRKSLHQPEDFTIEEINEAAGKQDGGSARGQIETYEHLLPDNQWRKAWRNAYEQCIEGLKEMDGEE